MRVMRSDIREVLPAAGAFVMGGFRHDGCGDETWLVQVVGDGVWHAWRMKAEAGDDGKSAERTKEPGEQKTRSRQGTIPARNSRAGAGTSAPIRGLGARSWD